MKTPPIICLVILSALVVRQVSMSAAVAAPVSPTIARWHCWLNVEGPICWGAGKQSLWMGVNSAIPWRYDLKTGAIDSATVLDGLPNERVEYTTVSPDGSLAFFTNPSGRIYVCRPGKNWQALPLLGEGMTPKSLDYDAGGRLLCAASSDSLFGLYEWRQSQWRHVRSLPPCTATIPAGNGVMLVGPINFGNHNYPVGFLGDGKRDVSNAMEISISMSPMGRCLLGENYYVFPMADELDGRTVWQHAWRILDGALKPVEAKATLLGIDYFRQDLLRVRKIARNEDGFTLAVDGVAELADLRIHLPGDYSGCIFPVRDANGHVWVGSRRWDGSQWREIVPARHVPPRFRDHSGLFRLDAATDCWMPLFKGDLPSLSGFDDESRTGWSIRYVDNRSRYKLMQVLPEGVRTLNTCEPDFWPGDALFRSSDGDWWFTWNRHISRFDARQAKFQEFAKPIGELFRSRNGNIWLRSDKTFARYDRHQNQFVSGTPWEEFAFRFGDWTLALLDGGIGMGQLYCRASNGQWQQFNAFGGDGLTLAGPRMICGQQMIFMASGVGVVLYDAQRRRSVVLDGSDGQWARVGFDEAGRPLLIGWYSSLLLEGDPFEAAMPAPVRARVGDLLEEMDDDRYQKRNSATTEMEELAGDDPTLVWSLLERSDLSAEVTYRLRQIAARQVRAKRRPVGLLRRMHPLLEPPPTKSHDAKPD